MEFLKKYWSKLILTIAMVVGAVLMIVPFFTMPKFQFLGFCQIFGIVLFFLGMATYYILKMVEAKKLVAAIALLTTGVLSTLTLVVGSFGFIYTKDIKATTKPEDVKSVSGIYGQMFYMGDMQTHAAEKGGSVALFNAVSKVDIKKSKKLKDFTADDEAKILAAVTKFVTNNKDNADYKASPYGVLQAYNLIPSATAELVATAIYTNTYATPKLITTAKTNKFADLKKDPTQAQIDALTFGDAMKGISADYKGALSLALVVLFTYISLILVMGLVPAVVGSKKLVCALGKCDCCGKEPVKASAAPVAYSAPAPVASSAPVAKPAAPKAPTRK